VEAHADPAIAAALTQRGHDVEVDPDPEAFGCGQIIWRLPTGAYVAGSDGRTDGCACGY
jgi:gamma-glutamyltranspeptidase/glutathione hydrolase